ncbi:MAG: GNAT family N-acetyltransferase [Haliangiales bacterium]
MQIREDDIQRADILALLAAHLRYAAETTPPENIYALDPEALDSPDITFYSARDDRDELLGCGALRQLSPEHGEIKSMHTAERARRQGVGRAMLAHLIAEARGRGYRQLSLETGNMDAFAAARSLYYGYGFVPCGRFGDYPDNPDSVFMTLRLD